MSRLLQRQKSNKVCLKSPEIPDKLYFTIGEASRLCSLEPHVLRYWEQEFPQLKPAKRRGNRRYYQKVDILLIRHIKQLLYVEGFTIEGAKNKLSAENGVNKGVNKTVEKAHNANAHNFLREIVTELDNILTVLDEDEGVTTVL